MTRFLRDTLCFVRWRGQAFRLTRNGECSATGCMFFISALVSKLSNTPFTLVRDLGPIYMEMGDPR